jgi:glyoxylase-like metal-dependent hydrolase (beta-lactamase superfamily II)
VRDVFFLSCGWFKAPAAVLEPLGRLPTLRAVRMSNTVGVVVRDNGDVVLVDCGWTRAQCARPELGVGRVHAKFLGMVVQRGDAVVDQLAMAGIARGRVKTVVATHLHLDHVGGVNDFPDAELVCSDVELSAARVRPPAKGYRPEDIETARLRPVNLGAGPSYGFPASHDLFGDGEIVLLDAHGHTPGAVAVAIRSRGAERCYVHIGDAAYRAWEWGMSPRGPSVLSAAMAWRRDLLKERYRSLRDCEADPRKPVIVPSHDEDVYARLPHAPRPSEAEEAAASSVNLMRAARALE